MAHRVADELQFRRKLRINESILLSPKLYVQDFRIIQLLLCATSIVGNENDGAVEVLRRIPRVSDFRAYNHSQ